MKQVTFSEVLNRTIGHEKGFQKMHSDRGNWTSGVVGVGELKGTKGGISAASYPDLDIENLTDDEIASIYHRDWWAALSMDRFRPAMSFQMFDAAINHGMHNASRMLQRAVGVKADGVIGPITRAAVREMDLDDLLMRFLAKRLYFMTDISTFNDYGRGWARRISDNLLYASEDN